jgi:hypothetical protein
MVSPGTARATPAAVRAITVAAWGQLLTLRGTCDALA